MKNKLLVIATIVSLILSTIALTASVRVIFPKEDNQVIIIEEGDTINQTIINQTNYYIQVGLEIGVRIEYPNGTVKRPIHNKHIYPVYNVTIIVSFPFSNETYRGSIEEVYVGPSYIPRQIFYAGYALWDITEIDGLYSNVEAYGWLREDA